MTALPVVHRSGMKGHLSISYKGDDSSHQAGDVCNLLLKGLDNACYLASCFRAIPDSFQIFQVLHDKADTSSSRGR